MHVVISGVPSIDRSSTRLQEHPVRDSGMGLPGGESRQMSLLPGLQETFDQKFILSTPLFAIIRIVNVSHSSITFSYFDIWILSGIQSPYIS